MSKHIGNTIAVLLILWIFWPWLIFSTDIAAWIFTGQTWSPIDWDKRGAAAFLWPLFWIFIVGIGSSLY